MCETVYLAEWCDCKYESGFSTISVHKTKAGAYRALRKKRKAVFDEGRDSYLKYGGITEFNNPLKMTASRMRQIEIEE
jgi:hypothetical protein